MNKIIIITIMTMLIPISFSAIPENIACTWEAPGVCPIDHVVLNAHGSPIFHDVFSGALISSQVDLGNAITRIPIDGNYNEVLCCDPSKGILEFWYDSNPNCGTGYSIVHLYNETNSRVAHEDAYNPAIHNHTICVEYTEAFSHLDLYVSNQEVFAQLYEDMGYTCLFRFSSNLNAHIGDCDSLFAPAPGTPYKYSVWMRIKENVDNLKCNTDCTSKLDGRVYSECSQKIRECRGITPLCDGSLYGSWVDIDKDLDGIMDAELQCSDPWNLTRAKVFSQDLVMINTTDECPNVVKETYSAMIDDQIVTMNVFICSKNINNEN